MAMKKRTIVILLLAPVLLSYGTTWFFRGLPSHCPSPEELQSDFVKSSFNHSKMNGMWYELAMKDITQPRRICQCQTSNKTVNWSAGVLWDEFAIQCYNNTYFASLSYTLDDARRGVVMGTWNAPLVNRIIFPNTIVDVEVDDENDGEYQWAIEFQCIQGLSLFGWNWIAFYAFNFYSRSYGDDERLQNMELRARQRGLGPFIDHFLELSIIIHSDCLLGH